MTFVSHGVTLLTVAITHTERLVMKKALIIALSAVAITGCSSMKEVQERKTYAQPSWYQECEQLSGSYDYCWCNRNVTHWMPLPEPPKNI